MSGKSDECLTAVTASALPACLHPCATVFSGDRDTVGRCLDERAGEVRWLLARGRRTRQVRVPCRAPCLPSWPDWPTSDMEPLDVVGHHPASFPGATPRELLLRSRPATRLALGSLLAGNGLDPVWIAEC